MFRWLLVLSFFCCAPLLGAELTVWRLPAGVYAVQDGAIVRVNELTLDPSPTPPGPGPVPDPTPALTARAKAIKLLAEKVAADPSRQETAGQLATLYSEISKKAKAGDIKTQEMIAFAVKYGTDSLLNGKGTKVKSAWQPVRDLFSEQWTAVLQEGGSDADYAKLLNEAADGLNASAPDKKAIDIAMIMAIIKMIMELIAMFS